MSMESFATIPFSESFNQFRLQSMSLNYISTSKSEISYERDVTKFSNNSTMMIDVKTTSGSGRSLANGVLFVLLSHPLYFYWAYTKHTKYINIFYRL